MEVKAIHIWKMIPQMGNKTWRVVLIISTDPAGDDTSIPFKLLLERMARVLIVSVCRVPW